jgi:glycosyltransferase involved in cell wall biosynthesis
MKIGIYTPYLDTLGGGERYVMSAAECLASNGDEVDVFWDDPKLKKQIGQRFSLNLAKVNFIKDSFSGQGLMAKKKLLGNYDVFLMVSDGSLPFLFAEKNLVHFQVPFQGLKGRSFLNRLKLLKIDQIICNSRFTKNLVDSEYGFGHKSLVVYPPVDTAGLKPLRKNKTIISVGRLGEALNNKKQEVLVAGFKQLLANSQTKDWRLIIVGGLKKGDEKYFDLLKKQANGLPVDFVVNASFEQLKNLYGQAAIFWHAAGFEESRPERMEHFGMVVVEAMAAGCVPVVVNAGGIPEIISHQQNGLLWDTKDQLIKLTLQLIKSENLRKKLSTQAVKDSQKFSKTVFCRKIHELVRD